MEALSSEEWFTHLVKQQVNNSAFTDALYLVSKGVPYDVAFSLDDVSRLAHVIVLGEQSGAVKWSWGAMEFVPVQQG